jgi:hypothetical protein
LNVSTSSAVSCRKSFSPIWLGGHRSELAYGGAELAKARWAV